MACAIIHSNGNCVILRGIAFQSTIVYSGLHTQTSQTRSQAKSQVNLLVNYTHFSCFIIFRFSCCTLADVDSPRLSGFHKSSQVVINQKSDKIIKVTKYSEKKNTFRQIISKLIACDSENVCKITYSVCFYFPITPRVV